MKKEYGIQLAIGCGLLLVAGMIAVLLLPGGHFDPWLNVILGAIAVTLIFPLILRWAIETKQKHKAVSIGTIILIAFWTLAWLAATTITIILTLKGKI